MKEKIFAVFMIAFTAIAITANTVFLSKSIRSIQASVEAIMISETDVSSSRADAERAFYNFKKNELFLGLTVNHDDLSTIESCFSELVGYLAAEDVGGAIVAKNRLTDALSHLRRLSGFNIDAII